MKWKWAMTQRHRRLIEKAACFDTGGLPELDPSFSDFSANRLNLSDNAQNVLKKRYLKKDCSGKIIETLGQMFLRVARHIAEAEKKIRRR